jgi:ATP-binding cassette subfamily A (ABC1) protein 3
MLIGEMGPTDGEIIINGINMQKDFNKARRHLGYCPQFSYLPEFLIVEECLELFADLKGVYSSIKFIIVEDLIRLFRLDEFRKKIVKHLR